MYEFVVVYCIDGESVIDHTRTVVGTLVGGVVVPFTAAAALAYAEATGGALWID